MSARPTKAIVRKSLFQRLEPWTGKRVCDLYAGIGSLGLEALSRGAAHVTFVENDTVVIEVLQRNLARAGAEACSSVEAEDVRSFLARQVLLFDVVLADPPYHSVSWEELHPAAREILRPGGVLVMEMPAQASVPDDLDVRVIGKTKVGTWRRPV